MAANPSFAMPELEFRELPSETDWGWLDGEDELDPIASVVVLVRPEEG